MHAPAAWPPADVRTGAWSQTFPAQPEQVGQARKCLARVLDGCPAGRLRVEVTDQGGPWTQPAAAGDQHGRGLLIVRRLGRHLGISGDHDARTVWFELTCPCPWAVPEPSSALLDQAGQDVT